MPGGIVTPAQWLALDSLATTYGNGTLRMSTRQAFQFHGIIKKGLKQTIRGINEALLSTIAACGDVTRNVMCSPLAEASSVHEATYKAAVALSEHLAPRTRAYHEIWLDGERVAGTPDHEPIYGEAYLPRKFKVTIAIPPSNDVDVFAHDLGLIAIEKNGELAGFNVAVGGGMGATHGEPETYPRVADIIGYCTVEQVVAVAEQVVAVQRDFGNRSNRKRARLKYTIDDRGLDWFRETLFERLGFALAPAEPFEFRSRGDRIGWQQDRKGRWHLALFIPTGRIGDQGEQRMLTGLREIARIHDGDFRLTPNQNLIVGNIAEGQRAAICSASFMSSASTRKKPPSCSLVSAYGPSVTDRLPWRTRTVAAVRLLRSGSVAISRPVSRNVSTYASVSARSVSHSAGDSAFRRTSSS